MKGVWSGAGREPAQQESDKCPKAIARRKSPKPTRTRHSPPQPSARSGRRPTPEKQPESVNSIHRDNEELRAKARAFYAGGPPSMMTLSAGKLRRPGLICPIEKITPLLFSRQTHQAVARP